MSTHDVAGRSLSPASSAATPIRIVVVDGHALIREGLRGVLGLVDDVEVVGEADNVDAAVKAVVAHEPDVVLVDLQLHDGDGVAVIRALAARAATPAIVVLSVDGGRDRVREALRTGARGFLLKSAGADELAAAIRQAAGGRWAFGEDVMAMLVDTFLGTVSFGVPPVTPREHEVLRLLADGLPNRAVAERLGISTRTAQKHVENLFKKFNVHGRADLVTVAWRAGLMN